MFMANMTIAIPDKLHKELKKFSDVRWSEVARKAIVGKLETLQEIERITNKSKLTSKDVEEFSKLVKKSSNKRFMNDIGR